MTTPRSKAKFLVLAPMMAAAAFTAFSGTSAKVAGAEDTDPAALRERCATRVSIALLGTSPSDALKAAPDPQSQVDAILKDGVFIERFARFANAKMNDVPGDNVANDSAYHMTKYVLQNNLQWKDMFVGQFNIIAGQNNASVTIQADPNGLGYFRSVPWLRRYAGNELTGLKLSTAYRILNNTVGLKLVASTNAPNADVSAAGRQAPACKSCHYDNWSALDKIAQVLTKRVGLGDQMRFDPPPAGAAGAQLLDTTIRDDKELVTTLVNSEHFKFNVCRTAFEFLYGRAENVCEGPVFDKCMAAFESTGMVQGALAAVAKDATFCQ